MGLEFDWDDIHCATVGEPVMVEGLLYQWTDVIRITGLTLADGVALADPSAGISYNWIFELFTSVDEIPAYGDPHPVYKRCFCTGVKLLPAQATNPLGKSPVDVDIAVSWSKISEHADSQEGNPQFRNRIQIDPIQGTEVKNFDVNHNETITYYLPTIKTTVALQNTKASDIRVPRVTQSLRITQYEQSEGEYNGDRTLRELAWGINGVFAPTYNSEAWGDFPENTVLYMGMRKANDGGPLFLTDYMFLINDRGWDKYTAVWTYPGGAVPPDIKTLPQDYFDPSKKLSDLIAAGLPNGIGAWDMLQSVNFKVAFPQLFVPGN